MYVSVNVSQYPDQSVLIFQKKIEWDLGHRVHVLVQKYI